MVGIVARPALVVQHLEPEAPYGIGTALDAAGVPVEVVRTDRGEPLPATTEELSGLVCMGGPMSAYDDTSFPSRGRELELLDDALSRGTPTLGVCLGAQLLAAATGARVYPGGVPEIGWGPVELTPDADADPLMAGLERRFDVLHWHGDTFDLPPQGVLLARSNQYENQAFRVGRAWGLQFHLEVHATAVDNFVTAMAADAAAAPGGVDGIRAGTEPALSRLRTIAATVLDRFAALVALPSSRRP